MAKTASNHHQLREAWDTLTASEGANLKMSSDFEPLLVGPPCLWDIVPAVRGNWYREAYREGRIRDLVGTPFNYKMSMEHLRGGSSGWLTSKSAVEQRSRLEIYFVDY